MVENTTMISQPCNGTQNRTHEKRTYIPDRQKIHQKRKYFAQERYRFSSIPFTETRESYNFALDTHMTYTTSHQNMSGNISEP